MERVRPLEVAFVRLDTQEAVAMRVRPVVNTTIIQRASSATQLPPVRATERALPLVSVCVTQVLLNRNAVRAIQPITISQVVPSARLAVPATVTACVQRQARVSVVLGTLALHATNARRLMNTITLCVQSVTPVRHAAARERVRHWAHVCANPESEALRAMYV